MKTLLIMLVVLNPVLLRAQYDKKFWSKEYGYGFSINKNYKLGADSLKPNYSKLDFIDSKRGAEIVIVRVIPAGYDSAAMMLPLAQMAALTPAAWEVELPKSYPGANFKRFTILDVGKKPGYRIDYETGKGQTKMIYSIICVYAKLCIYNLQMAISQNSMNFLDVLQEKGEFDHMLNTFIIN